MSNGPKVETTNPPNKGPLSDSLSGQMNCPNIHQNLGKGKNC